MRTGIFGGSFNPIHCGHIALARHLMQKAALDEVWFVVSPLNPFKTRATDLLADNERLRLTRKALQGEAGLVASDYEFRLPRPSFMWNTLQHLSADYPDRQFVLIIGADNWLAFDRWAHSQDILAHYELAVYPRTGYAIDARQLPPGVRLVDTPLYPVSSTLIRQRLLVGGGIEGLVPQSIIDDVRQLYGPSAQGRMPQQ